MSDSAVSLAAPDSIEFASGHPPVTSLTGKTEHIALTGESDMLLIYPATANTVSKIACGIDDTPVTSVATVAIGSGIPVALAPAMHESMYRNPAVSENMRRLESMGITFIGPRTDGVRAKVASRAETVETVIRMLSGKKLSGKKILIIGGRSEEPLDSMRVITNRSSGRMACALAVRTFEAGADTELWMGGCDTELPDFIPVRRFSSVSDLLKMTGDIDADAVLVPAALADFAPAKADGKIPSDGSITLKLDPVPKVLPVLCGKCGFVLGFKAESGLPEKELIEKARGRLRKYGLSAIVANDVSCAGKPDSEAVFVTAGSAERISGSKDGAAGYILDRIAEML